MARYVCNSCNYKFESNKLTPPKRCPYCSSERGLNAEASASDLLAEVTEILDREDSR